VTKKLLSPAEIQQLIQLLKGVFVHISDLKAENPLAKYIQYPKLPPSLTESLAIRLLRMGVIKGLGRYEFQFGGNEADIIGKDSQSRLRIEVKGTTKGFEYFGEKDINSDYLMWFDLADLLRKTDGDDHLRLYVIAQPSSHFERPVKIVISKLKRIAKKDVTSLDYGLSALLDQLAGAQTGGQRMENWT